MNGGTSGAGGPAIAGASSGGAGGSGPGPSTSEDEGADCTVAPLPDAATLPTIQKLPDPFTKLDGSAVTTLADWRCRREELKKQAQKYAFGTKPTRPNLVTGSVTSKLITVNVADQGKTVTFTANIKLPSGGQAPYPAIIAYNGTGPGDQTVLDAEGVARIDLNVSTIGAETGQRGANQTGAFYSLYGGGSKTGLLIAWAWGVSRVIDVLENSGSTLIDPRAIGVTGCSRYGKGSFIAGAFDDRIALTLPVESGTAGVPVWRGVEKAELGDNGQPPISLLSTYNEQPWFSDGFQPFVNAATKIPIDTHELAGLVAPRGLLILDNPYVGELSPNYGALAALAGAEVYRALGVGDRIGYISDVASGIHCAGRPEWRAPLQDAIKRFLKKTSTAPTPIRVKPGHAADLAVWRDWTTPTLQ